jgi:hypothetical protein
MNWFDIFALLGMPLVALAIGYGAMRLNEAQVRRHHHTTPAE